MRVVTWNVNSLRARLDHVRRFTEEVQPDVLCLQELKLEQEQIPVEALQALGWPHVEAYGQAAYNGVALLSKHPIEQVQRGLEAFPDDHARVIAGTVRGVRIYGLYTPNGQAVGSEAFLYKLAWLEALREELARRFTPQDRLLVCGDMNVAPDDLDLWDPFAAEGHVHAHPDERAALARLREWGLVDTWREAHEFDQAFSFWDYQKMAFQRNHGMRIDHIYLTAPLQRLCREVTIHRDVRGWDTPSDHAPVSCVLDLPPEGDGA